MALPFKLKKYLKAKEEELWKLKIISPCKNNIIFKIKILLKKTKILQDIITLL
jgi:hypothetical protein